ncbi:MAG: methyltransferase domain-containing protein, partial [Planctomycetota bacterium]
LEGAEVAAIDVSEEALDWARRNAEELGATVRLVQGEGLERLDELTRQHGPFDVVVSNPPYVEPQERDDLAPEVREHEPALALYAPPGDPDHWVRSLIEGAADTITSGGLLAVELGHRQSERALAIASAHGDARLVDDLEGIPRVLEMRR